MPARGLLIGVKAVFPHNLPAHVHGNQTGTRATMENAVPAEKVVGTRRPGAANLDYLQEAAPELARKYGPQGLLEPWLSGLVGSPEKRSAKKSAVEVLQRICAPSADRGPGQERLEVVMARKTGRWRRELGPDKAAAAKVLGRIVGAAGGNVVSGTRGADDPPLIGKKKQCDATP